MHYFKGYAGTLRIMKVSATLGRKEYKEDLVVGEIKSGDRQWQLSGQDLGLTPPRAPRGPLSRLIHNQRRLVT